MYIGCSQIRQNGIILILNWIQIIRYFTSQHTTTRWSSPKLVRKELGAQPSLQLPTIDSNKEDYFRRSTYSYSADQHCFLVVTGAEA